MLWGKGKETKADQEVPSESKSNLLEIASFPAGNQVAASPTFSVQNSDHRVNGESSTNEV